MMIVLRFSSPVSWLASVVLFFLPWVDIRCTSQKDHQVDHATFSGAQLAWGGRTTLEPAAKRQWTLGDASVQHGEYLLVSFLLSLYLLGLLYGLGFAAMTPTPQRAVTGMIFASIVLGLLVCGSLLALGNPGLPGKPLRIFKTHLMEATYTPWYYGSYVANFVALLSFVLEYAVLRRRRHRQAAVAKSVED
jgi:hypothetical protein